MHISSSNGLEPFKALRNEWSIRSTGSIYSTRAESSRSHDMKYWHTHRAALTATLAKQLLTGLFCQRCAVFLHQSETKCTTAHNSSLRHIFIHLYDFPMRKYQSGRYSIFSFICLSWPLSNSIRFPLIQLIIVQLHCDITDINHTHWISPVKSYASHKVQIRSHSWSKAIRLRRRTNCIPSESQPNWRRNHYYMWASWG